MVFLHLLALMYGSPLRLSITIVPISHDGIMFCLINSSAFLANIIMFSSSASENVPYLFLNIVVSLSVEIVSVVDGMYPLWS